MAKDKNEESDLTSAALINKRLNHKGNYADAEGGLPAHLLSPYSQERLKRENLEHSRYLEQLCLSIKDKLYGIEKMRLEELLGKEILKRMSEKSDDIKKIFEKFADFEKSQEGKHLIEAKLEYERLARLRENTSQAKAALDRMLQMLETQKEYYLKEINRLDVEIKELKAERDRLDVKLNDKISIIGQTIIEYASHPIENFEPAYIIFKFTDEELARKVETGWDGRIEISAADNQKAGIALGEKIINHKVDCLDSEDMRNSLKDNLKTIELKKAEELVKLTFPDMPLDQRNHIIERNFNLIENTNIIENKSDEMIVHLAKRDVMNDNKLKPEYEEAGDIIKSKEEVNIKINTDEKQREQYVQGVNSIEKEVEHITEFKRDVVELEREISSITESGKCTSEEFDSLKEGGVVDNLFDNIGDLDDLISGLDDEIQEQFEEKETTSFRP